MNLFKHVESGRRVGPRRILLYDTCGIGLSSFAAGLPAPPLAPSPIALDGAVCGPDMRVIYTTPSPVHVAKNHLDPPSQLPLRLDALALYLDRTFLPSHLPPAHPN